MKNFDPDEWKEQMEAEGIDFETQEEVMEYLSRSITGEKLLKLRIVPAQTSFADTENKEVYIQEAVPEAIDAEQLKRFWKGLNCHESAHIIWSGHLMNEYKRWDTKDGDFKDFKDTVNVIEDVRIEHVMTKVLPQTKKYFVEFLERFAEVHGKEMSIETENILMALRIALENKTDKVKYKIAPEAEPFIKEAVDKFNEMEILEGNWKDVVKCSYEVHKIFQKFRKNHPELNGATSKLQSDMKQIDEKIMESDEEFKDLKSDGDKLNKDQDDLDDEKKDLENQKDKGELSDEEYDDKKEELDEKQSELDKKKSDLEKSMEENKQKYEDLTEQRKEKSRELEKEQQKKEKSKDIDGFVRVTDFEEREEAGELAELDAQQIVDEMERRGLIMEVEVKEEGDFKEMERHGSLGVPDVAEYGHEDTYEGAYYKIPEVSLAIEMGDEISSELKRHLNLKKSMVKRKSSGKLDMQRIRKQYTYYGKIVDTDIFQRGRAKLPEHSVMVMIDLSGSMAGRKIMTAKQALATLGRTLAQLGVNHCIRGYTALTSRNVMADVLIKDFSKEEIDYSFVDRVYYPKDKYWGQNRDGDSWRYGAEQLAQQPGDKLLIVISDGLPNHGGTTYVGKTAFEDSKLAIQQIEAMGIKCLGISIDSSANTYIGSVFKNSFFFDGDKLEELGEGLTEVYIETMKFG